MIPMKKFSTPIVLILAAFCLLCMDAQALPSRRKLPKVLIIGDSISMGYTPYVRKNLKGLAVVRHHRGNAGPTIRGLEDVEKWLGSTKWAVIHFNWGLWDMYGWKYEEHDRNPKVYEDNLNRLVARLKSTGAQLIWATTTPACPDPEEDSGLTIHPETESEYLKAALRVMKKHNIQINDLHSLMAPVRAQYARGNNDVHYKEEGYRIMANQTTDLIKTALIGMQEREPAGQ